MRALSLVLAMIWLAALSAMASSEEQNGQSREPITLYSPAQLARMIQNGEPVVLLDVREPEEFAKNHLPGAINIPRREFATRHAELPPDALVIPYCNMDFRGFVAVEELWALGVKHLGLMQKRGIEGWRASELPIVEKSGKSDDQALKALLALDPDKLPGLETIERVEPTGKVARFDVEVSEWYFDPNDIRVKAGDRVDIVLTSRKGSHFFILPDFELQAEVPAGQTRTVSFIADRRGTFRFGSCEWDGSALQVMKGRISID